MITEENLAHVSYQQRSKMVDNVYQFMEVSFNHGAITDDGTVINIEQSFPVLYYYPAQNRFWVPQSNTYLPDQVIVKW